MILDDALDGLLEKFEANLDEYKDIPVTELGRFATSEPVEPASGFDPVRHSVRRAEKRLHALEERAVRDRVLSLRKELRFERSILRSQRAAVVVQDVQKPIRVIEEKGYEQRVHRLPHFALQLPAPVTPLPHEPYRPGYVQREAPTFLDQFNRDFSKSVREAGFNISEDTAAYYGQLLAFDKIKQLKLLGLDVGKVIDAVLGFVSTMVDMTAGVRDKYVEATATADVPLTKYLKGMGVSKNSPVGLAVFNDATSLFNTYADRLTNVTYDEIIGVYEGVQVIRTGFRPISREEADGVIAMTKTFGVAAKDAGRMYVQIKQMGLSADETITMFREVENHALRRGVQPLKVFNALNEEFLGRVATTHLIKGTSDFVDFLAMTKGLRYDAQRMFDVIDSLGDDPMKVYGKLQEIDPVFRALNYFDVQAATWSGDIDRLTRLVFDTARQSIGKFVSKRDDEYIVNMGFRTRQEMADVLGISQEELRETLISLYREQEAKGVFLQNANEAVRYYHSLEQQAQEQVISRLAAKNDGEIADIHTKDQLVTLLMEDRGTEAKLDETLAQRAASTQSIKDMTAALDHQLIANTQTKSVIDDVTKIISSDDYRGVFTKVGDVGKTITFEANARGSEFLEAEVFMRELNVDFAGYMGLKTAFGPDGKYTELQGLVRSMMEVGDKTALLAEAISTWNLDKLENFAGQTVGKNYNPPKPGKAPDPVTVAASTQKEMAHLMFPNTTVFSETNVVPYAPGNAPHPVMPVTGQPPVSTSTVAPIVQPTPPGMAPAVSTSATAPYYNFSNLFTNPFGASMQTPVVNATVPGTSSVGYMSPVDASPYTYQWSNGTATPQESQMVNREINRDTMSQLTQTVTQSHYAHFTNPQMPMVNTSGVGVHYVWGVPVPDAPQMPDAAVTTYKLGGVLDTDRLKLESEGVAPPPVELTDVVTRAGLKAKVAAQYSDRFQGLINDLEGNGYPVRVIHGYYAREIRGYEGTGKWSNHAFGAAIDINPEQNPLSETLITDMPSNVRELAAAHTLRWGGVYRSRKDAMHFEVVGANGERATTPVAAQPAAPVKTEIRTIQSKVVSALPVHSSAPKVEAIPHARRGTAFQPLTAFGPATVRRTKKIKVIYEVSGTVEHRGQGPCMTVEDYLKRHAQS